MKPLALMLAHAVFALGLVAADDAAKRRVFELKGKVFDNNGQVGEVVLNATQVEDKDLAFLLAFPELSDLSLENTRVGDAGIVQCQGFQRLDGRQARQPGVIEPRALEVEPPQSATLNQQVEVRRLDRSIGEPDRNHSAGLVDPHTPAAGLQLLDQSIHAVSFLLDTTASCPFQIGQGIEAGGFAI